MAVSNALLQEDATAPWYAGLTPRHWRILWGAYLGWIFDGYEAVALVYAYERTRWPQFPLVTALKVSLAVPWMSTSTMSSSWGWRTRSATSLLSVMRSTVMLSRR